MPGIKPGKKASNPPVKKSAKRTPAKKRSKPSDDIILVPVDFYPHSAAALRFAANMAQLMKAQIIVLHVVHDPVDVPGFYVHEEKKERRLRRMEDVAADMLTRFMNKVIEDSPDLPAIRTTQTKLIVGIPVTRILEVVMSLRPKCVVMGSQGRSGLSQVFVGSTAEKVVHLCPVPVTIVKTEKNLNRF